MRIGFRALALSALLASSSAFAQDGEPDARLILENGDTLTVRIIDNTGDNIIVGHPTLGEISIPRDRVQELVILDAQDAGDEQAAATEGGEAPETGEAPAIEEKSPWTGSINIGLNGQEGNTTEVDFTIRANALRDTEETILRLDFAYLYGTDEGDTTDNEAYFRVRNDWKFSDSRWSWFAQGQVDFDQFEDWTWRASAFTGPAYRFIDTDKTRLTGRIGAGYTQEFGGDDDGRIEGLLGVDFAHEFNERLSLTAMGEYFPDISDGFKEYRLVGEAGLTFKLNEDGSFILTAGVRDEYDSDPGDAEHNDFYYFITLGYAF